MSSISEKLEHIFDERLETFSVEQINELVQLMSLSDKECEQKFLENKDLQNKYFSKNTENVFALKEPKTEDEYSSSEEEEEIPKHNVKMHNASTSKPSYWKKRTEFSFLKNSFFD